jgi:hypothetical protein
VRLAARGQTPGLPNRNTKDETNNRPMKRCRNERNQIVILTVEKPSAMNVKAAYHRPTKGANKEYEHTP